MYSKRSLQTRRENFLMHEGLHVEQGTALVGTRGAGSPTVVPRPLVNSTPSALERDIQWGARLEVVIPSEHLETVIEGNRAAITCSAVALAALGTIPQPVAHVYGLFFAGLSLLTRHFTFRQPGAFQEHSEHNEGGIFLGYANSVATISGHGANVQRYESLLNAYHRD